VARRAAAQVSDPRWFFLKVVDGVSSWEAFKATAARAVPSPWGAVVWVMVGSFLKSAVEQAARGRAADADHAALRAETERLLAGQRTRRAG
jgi:hypothetical protein